MDFETLKHARERCAKSLEAATRKRREANAELDRLKHQCDRLLMEITADGRDAFIACSGKMYDAAVAAADARAHAAASENLSCFLYGLTIDWRTAMPGYGTGGAHSFVRSFRIEDGRPVAFDPFWIDGCSPRNSEGDQERLRLHAVWASGGNLRPGGTGPSDPAMKIKKPFGSSEEAARTPCGTCGADGYVVVYEQLCHFGEEENPLFLQGLYALCLACPTLTTLAERRDPAPVPRLYL